MTAPAPLRSDELKGQSAIVTGGAQGIRRTIVDALAAMGARAAIADIQGEAAARVSAEVSAAYEVAAFAVSTDVSQRTHVDDLARRVLEDFGSVQILVCAAGGLLGHVARPLEQTADEAWHDIVNVNLHGTFYVCRAFIGRMKKQRYGGIVNITSGAGRSVSRTKIHAYTTAKAAVYGFTREMAKECGPFGITANSVAPGFVMTPLGRDQWAMKSQEEKDDLMKSIAVGRTAEAQEIAAVTAFLCTPRAGYVTGQVIGVDGGHWMFG
ncbi:MAG: SDR family oxidoreductase [Armatimonadetes bacterium]|nr:SDR family oxidoreductase [Armatimonadota bacterium]